jgi:glycosyltransferase involved in cell wall biosynthesis
VLFSLLIANYNNGKFFKDCYESIIQQTYRNWEAVIVDDGSTDDSEKIIRKLIGSDERFKFYKNDKNYGCGYTKRKCAELATGELCAFLDPDDALLANALGKMRTAFINNPDVVLVHSSLFYCNEVLEKEKAYTQASAVNNSDMNFFNHNHSVTAFAAFSRKAYLKTDGIEPYIKRAVDQDLYLKMFETGKFHFVNEPLYLYRRHSNGISVNMEKGRFWYWFVVMQAAKRRNIDIGELFIKTFVKRKKYNNPVKSFSTEIFLKLTKIFSPILRLLRYNKLN